MENLAHTLLGLSFAKAGLERATPLATTALVISSNLPDIDLVAQLGGGGTLTYLEHHRGITHSLVGLPALAALLALALLGFDRLVRLRRDPFLRPARPLRLFWLALLGGLGHAFMDFTNSYGVRPLLPFSDRWFYGDMVFVVDPWIWLILGSATVWLSATDKARAAFWALVGVGTALLMALALRQPSPESPAIPTAARVVWFVGLAVVLGGAAAGWRRAGARLARYALLLLAVYYGGMWVARQTARGRAAAFPPVENAATLSAWPTPANPLLWQAVSSADDLLYTRSLSLLSPAGEWRAVDTLEPRLLEALRRSEAGRGFLKFTRYAAASVAERQDGYQVVLRDLRFDLRLTARLDRDLAVRAAEARWY